MGSSHAKLAMQMLTLMLLSIAFDGTLLNKSEFSDGLHQGITSTGGSTILLEEYTATWCVICIEVDRKIEDFLQPNGERVAFISLHPADGIDELGNSASATRLDWMLQNNSGTPTFIFDGKEESSGAVSISQLHADLMSAESARPQFTEITMRVNLTGSFLNFELHLTEGIDLNESLSILIVEDDITSVGPNGERMRFDHVLRGMISAEMSDDGIKMVNYPSDMTVEYIQNESSISGSMIRVSVQISAEWQIDTLGFVGVHEGNEEGVHQVYGVVQVVSRSSNLQNGEVPWYIGVGAILICGILLAAGFASPSKKIPTDSEE